ncbi:hypothetical protein HPB50_025989 [Hyalomma asiaticum]|uniref:Uncharacterized protein n=1 Tax=Hyalomma asiaticum TaxID=266040 RepID=A0ACB7STV4_HYAAI|nr:hypothetical protein HPB50_025989 [Hyalomma asiaticum]
MAFNRVASPLFLVFLAAMGSGVAAEEEAPSVLRSMLQAFARQGAAACTPIATTKLTKADKEALVTKHNEYRTKVAGGELASFPKASNMRKLMWHDELAAKAQATADKCDPSKRESGASLDVGGLTGVHQNLGHADLAEKNVDVAKFVGDIIKKWYDGSAKFKPDGLVKYPAATTGEGEDFAQAKAGGAGGSAAGESKAEEGGFTFLSAVGVIGTLLAVGAVIAAVVHMHKAQAAAGAPAAAAAPADGAHPAEEAAAGGSHEAAAGDVPPGEHKEPGAEPEKSAEVHDAPGASQDALAKK